jgi:hypothetical protein
MVSSRPRSPQKGSQAETPNQTRAAALRRNGSQSRQTFVCLMSGNCPRTELAKPNLLTPFRLFVLCCLSSQSEIN